MNTDILQTIDPRDLGRRIQEARKERGLTQADIAAQLDMARTTVTAIEKGERRIQPGELVQLAALLGRSIGDFLRRGAPSPSFVVQFRAVFAPGKAIGDEIEPHFYAFQRLCEDYRRLEEICGAPLPRRYPEPYAIDGVTPEQAAEDIASAERNRLGLGDGPIPDLREMLESSVGLRVFYMALPHRYAAMFAYTEEFGGCIAINRNHPEERRRMSLAHDYFHFLTRRYQPEVAAEAMYDRNPLFERAADAFARAFLMPAAGLRRQFNDVKRSRNGKSTLADILTIAYHFFVSAEALMRRLEELRLVPSGTWDRFQQRGLKVREAQEILGLIPRTVRDELLPVRYVLLAIEAFVEREAITEKQFADFLRVDRLESRMVAARFAEDTDEDFPFVFEGSPDAALPLGENR